MDYETLQDILDANGSIVYADDFLGILIAWGGEGRFNVYQEVETKRYTCTDTFYIPIAESQNVRWACRQAVDYMERVQEEQLS